MRIFALHACVFLALGGVVTQASTDFEVGPRVLDPMGVTNDALGFSMAAFPLTAGGAIAVAGAIGYVALARLPLAANAFTIEQRLQSGLSNDSYGLSVAMAGPDAELVAVGAPADDSFGENSGRVYLYRRPAPGALYALLDTVDPPVPAATANFGTSVALAADGQTLVVGEPKAVRMAQELGAVHVYAITGSVVGPPQSFIGDLGAGARFGQAVAIDGNRIGVGAPLADDPAMLTDTGGLRVLTLNGGIPTADGAALFAAERASEDRLGLAVAIEGDVLVGGAGNDNKAAGSDAGSASVFRRAAGWQEEAKLRSSQPLANERFGQSVDIRATEILVGAYCLNAGGCTGPGAVYVFAYDGTNWASKQRLTAPDAGSFGHAVSFAGEGSIAIGAFGTDGAFTDQGAIYAAVPADALLEDGFE
jgi:hypothetical protein